MRVTWAINPRYRYVLSSSWLSRLSALTRVPFAIPWPNQTVLTVSQSRETGTSDWDTLVTILSSLFQTSTCTEFQLTLKTFTFDLRTFRYSSTQPNSTYNRSKSRKWDKWVLPLMRVTWAIYPRYRYVLSSRWLSRFSASTRVDSF